MPTGITEVPAEVLITIASALCYHCERRHDPSRPLNIWDQRELLQKDNDGLRSLRSLCLTNKLLCSVAQPILYHHLSPFYWNWRVRTKPMLVPVMQTLLEIPSLADRLMDVDIRYIVSSEIETYNARRLLHALAQRFPVRNGLPGDNDSEIDIENLLMNYLLCLAPNLEILCLGIIPLWSFSTFSGAVRDGHTSGLHSLRTLSLTGPKTPETSGSFRGVGQILANAPNLQTLRLDLDYLPPSMFIQNLQKLELTVDFGRSELKEALRQCLRLQEFYFSGNTYSAHESAVGSEIIQALEPAQDTLRCLKIGYMNQTPCIKSVYSSIASLRQFRSLQHVDLSKGLGMFEQRSLYVLPARSESFVDMLPDSIEVFCPPCWPEALLGLADAVARGRFPNLRLLELEHGLSNFNAMIKSRSWAKSSIELRRILDTVGVDVTFARDRVTVYQD